MMAGIADERPIRRGADRSRRVGEDANRYNGGIMAAEHDEFSMRAARIGMKKTIPMHGIFGA